MNWYNKKNVSGVHVSKKTSLSFYVEEAVNKLFSKNVFFICVQNYWTTLMREFIFSMGAPNMLGFLVPLHVFLKLGGYFI